MKRLLLLLLTVIPLSGAVVAMGADNARPAAARAFIEAPAQVFPLIDSLTRLDMVDYAMAGLDNGSQNSAGSTSRIRNVAADSLVIEMSEGVTHTLYLLPAKGGDTVFALVRTLALPALDSSVELFDSRWQPLKNASFATPGLDGWLNAPDKETRRRAAAGIPFVTARAVIFPAEAKMVVYNTLDKLLPRETLTEFGPFIYPSLTYKWDGAKFKLVK